MRFSALTGGLLALALGALTSGALVAAAEESSPTTLTPTQARTIALSRCGSNALSTAAANCRGFDAREIREKNDIFVLGFENNAELNEKHVMQMVLVFDLSQIVVGPNDQLSHATLVYTEASTTRRSATGDSEYGILPTCNTKLGVPTTEWNGSVNSIVATTPALIAGASPATTGDFGSWDITPQISKWLADGQTKGTLVMGADDQSPNIQGQSMCLSYLFDMNMNVEVTPKP